MKGARFMRAQSRLSAIILSLALLGSFVLIATPGLAAPPRLNCTAANAAITSPKSGATVSGLVQVEGSASLGAQFKYYKLEVSPAGRDAFSTIGNQVTQPVNGGQLGAWDSASAGDGAYTLRLRVVDATGNYCDNPEATVSGIIVQNSSPVAPTDTPAPTETEGAVPTSVVPTAIPTIKIPGGDSASAQAKATGQATPSSTRAASSPSSLIPGGFDVGGITGALGDVFSGYMRAFIFGIIAMAGILLLVGVIFYVRRVL